MTAHTVATLKGYFNTGDVPTETNFADMLDSVLVTTGVTGSLGVAAAAAENFRLRIESYGNVAPFSLVSAGHTYNAVWDDVLFFGYNVAADGGAIVAGVPQIFQFFEADYFNAGEHGMEWNMNVTPTTGDTCRAMYFYAERETLHQMNWQFRIGITGHGTFSVLDPTGLITYLAVNATQVTVPTDLILSRTGPGAAVQFSETARFIVPAGTFNFSADGGTTQHAQIGDATIFRATTMGFYSHVVAAQPAHVADATDAASVILRLNDLLARLEGIGLLATGA